MRRRRLLQLAAAFAGAWPALADPPPVSERVPIAGVRAPEPLPPPKAEPPGLAPALEAAQAFSDRLGGTSLLVSFRGRLVHERYGAGVDAATPLKTYSMAKSVLGLVYGIAVDQGVVALDDPLGRHVAELSGDPRGAITLRQLLQMRSGLKLASLARGDPDALALVTGRGSTEIALATPLVGRPGDVFEYENVDALLAGLALDRALVRAGRGRYVDFLSRALWRPLGQADATLDVAFAPDGEPRFFAGLGCCARDWLRIGQLIADGGVAHGRRIVSRAWLKAMTTPSANPAYGLLIWLGGVWTPERTYGPHTPSVVPCREPYLARDLVFFDGAGGQRVYVAASLDLVIVRTGTMSRDWEDSTLPNTLIRGLT